MTMALTVPPVDPRLARHRASGRLIFSTSSPSIVRPWRVTRTSRYDVARASASIAAPRSAPVDAADGVGSPGETGAADPVEGGDGVTAAPDAGAALGVAVEEGMGVGTFEQAISTTALSRAAAYEVGVRLGRPVRIRGVDMVVSKTVQHGVPVPGRGRAVGLP
jgi:hypothetical protein